MSTNEIDWLMNWYAANCDGDWEHQNGITIETLDNPGWRIKIDLAGTPLEGKSFSPQEHDLARGDYWWTATLEGGAFCAYCGPKDLNMVIGVFREWAERPSTEALSNV